MEPLSPRIFRVFLSVLFLTVHLDASSNADEWTRSRRGQSVPYENENLRSQQKFRWERRLRMVLNFALEIVTRVS